ncbi:MAG: phosphatase PAP2 family protein [Pirellulales bacterium]|nr:phosphatase PAP2 family protein [Pirellulales bacterium]
MTYANRRRALGLVVMLFPCAACSQSWQLAHSDASLAHEPPAASASLADAASEPTAGPRPAAAWHQPAAPSATVFAGGPPLADAGFRPLPQQVFDPSRSLLLQDPAFAPDEPFGAAGYAAEPAHAGLGFRSHWQRSWCEIRCDHANYYSWRTVRDLGYGIAFGSVLANTSLDEDFRGWYQDDVRSSGSDDYAAFWKTFGEGQIFIPAFAGLGLVGHWFEDVPLLGTAGDYGGRVTRGYLVGAPPMLAMQFCLGGSRPGEVDVGSRWKPFDDSNAVSGHAFMGSVPFITAAQMVEDPWAKGALYVCSTFTAWSRVNDDDHYLSQACLGWWMGYLACRAVNETEYADGDITLLPLASPELVGIGMVVRR